MRAMLFHELGEIIAVKYILNAKYSAHFQTGITITLVGGGEHSISLENDNNSCCTLTTPIHRSEDQTV